MCLHFLGGFRGFFETVNKLWDGNIQKMSSKGTQSKGSCRNCILIKITLSCARSVRTAPFTCVDGHLHDDFQDFILCAADI
jgi:hypothetical protein